MSVDSGSNRTRVARMSDVEAKGPVSGRTGAGPGRYYYDSSEKRRWRPCLVPAIVLASVAVFVVEMYVNDCPDHYPRSSGGSCIARPFLRRFSFQPLRENPMLGPSSSTLMRLGALGRNNVVHQHQGWRLVTSIWLHAGLIHLLTNMLSLLFVGIRLEQQFGFARIGTIYLVSGFGGSMISALLLQNTVSVGASGALFGLLGAVLSELFINWTIYSNRVAALLTLLIVVVINLAVGIFPHVDSFAHIGGFLSGFLLGFVLLVQPRLGWLERHVLPPSSPVMSKYKGYQYTLWITSLLLLIAGFTVALVMLFKGVNGNDHCHWCHYLNCVPTSGWSCET